MGARAATVEAYIPYIARDQRPELDEHLRPLIEAVGDEPGKLSYAVYALALGYIGDAPTYATYAEALGIAETVKLEIYRRHAAKREDSKIIVNGDVERPR